MNSENVDTESSLQMHMLPSVGEGGGRWGRVHFYLEGGRAGRVHSAQGTT